MDLMTDMFGPFEIDEPFLGAINRNPQISRPPNHVQVEFGILCRKTKRMVIYHVKDSETFMPYLLQIAPEGSTYSDQAKMYVTEN